MKFCRAFVCVVVLLACSFSSALAQPGAYGYAPGQVLVRLKNPTSEAKANDLLDSDLYQVKQAIVPSLDIYLVSLAPKTTVESALIDLKKNPAVRWVQADHILAERAFPNDPQFPTQWNLNQSSDADIDAPEAWDIVAGGKDAFNRDIVVAVVDGGCLLSHPDLQANIWINPGEVAGDSIDNDGNGYVDDINGWSAYDSSGVIPITNHGTHVSGIIGAVGNNATYTAGVNWRTKIMLVAASSTQTSIVATGYNYIITQKNRWWTSGGTAGANVVVSNSSFGVNYADCETGEYPIWNDLYDAMGQIGILSACATANVTIDVDVVGDVPTGCSSPFIISVTNTTSTDEKNSRAGYGDLSIDLGAPGTNIRSLMSTGGSGTLSGTSMSTPHVSGAVALMFAAADSAFLNFYSSRPDSAALILKQLLLDHVDILPGFDTLTVSGGRLNLYHAVQAIQNYIPPDTVLRWIQVVAPNGGEMIEIGGELLLQWVSEGVPESVNVELDRDFPSGVWESLFTGVASSGTRLWLTNGQTTPFARIRVYSTTNPAIGDTSDADFVLLGPPPKLVHNPLDDIPLGSGAITAFAWDTTAERSITDVRMIYRTVGSAIFDTLDLMPTGYLNEFYAGLGYLPEGHYEYYVSTHDNAFREVTVPSAAPADLYAFRIDSLCQSVIGYDDGTGEYSTWCESGTSTDFIWAVKFGPVALPFRLCGAEFAVSNEFPDSIHQPVRVLLYRADGPLETPGTILQDIVCGSIGNDIGGMAGTTNWARAIFRDENGDELTLTDSEFYIGLQNLNGKLEAFMRDSDSPSRQHSYFYDPCAARWYSDEDTLYSVNARGGNRMIRARGYSLLPPQVVHDPLDDQLVGSGTVTAWAISNVPDLTVAQVVMRYRLAGGGGFDALPLTATGNPNEYAASLTALPTGRYEYYMEGINSADLAATVPFAAPDSLYRFVVTTACGLESSYDDGTAEAYNWNEWSLRPFEWAIKVSPVSLPYYLCGARFAAARALPDSLHSPVQITVYAADGTDGLPGSILRQTVTGSVGNVIGGLPAGTHWADVSLKDAWGQPLTVTDSTFYIAVANPTGNAFEGFGRDTTGENAHRSFFYDACLQRWFSEDDTALSENACPGNRLIHPRGFTLTPPVVTAYRDSSHIVLHWASTGAPTYNVYLSTVSEGPYSLLQTVSDTACTVTAVDTAGFVHYYQVRSAIE